MDRREMLKKLAIGGVAVAGGTGLLAAPAISKPPADRGGGKPGPDPEPTPTEPTPTPIPGDPIGVPLIPDSPAFVEFLTYKGGKGAKARLRVKAGGDAYHGWQQLKGGDGNVIMEYESMALDYVDLAVPVSGDDTYPAYLDVKAGFGMNRPYTGSFSFYYWHGPSNAPAMDDLSKGVYTNATYYEVTVFVVEGSVSDFAATAVAPPTADQLVSAAL